MRAQEPDTASAIMIKYDVHYAIKQELRDLMGKPSAPPLHLILKDEYVIVKEDLGGNNFSLYDTHNKMVYECYFVADSIVAREGIPYFLDLTEVESGMSDSVAVFEGYDCRSSVYYDGSERLMTWHTDVFGVGFAPFGEIDGIPLYFEKVDGDGEKIAYEAVDVVPIKAPTVYFSPGEFGKLIGIAYTDYASDGWPVEFQAVTLNGTRVDNSKFDAVQVILMWSPESDLTLAGKFRYFEELAEQFKNKRVLFMAMNDMGFKATEEIFGSAKSAVRHIPKSKRIMEDFFPPDKPRILLLDNDAKIHRLYYGSPELIKPEAMDFIARDIQALIDQIYTDKTE